MLQHKPDILSDIHGTETVRHCFIVGPEGPAGQVDPIDSLVNEYKVLLDAENSDFQTTHGFPKNKDGFIDSICTNHFGEKIRSLCLTLEMPFYFSTNRIEDGFGWSPERSLKLGADNVIVLTSIIDRVREEMSLWR